MILLALDSTAIVATAALMKDGEILAQETIDCGKTHSETLLPLIETLYHKTNISPKDTDVFACSAGPGSFTGVRIGTALLKGMAYPNKPCVGVSTLEALAENLIGFDGIIAPVMDARRGQVYNALFRCQKGKLFRLTPDRILMLSELQEELSSYREPIYFCGDGYRIAQDFVTYPMKMETPSERIMQNAGSVAVLAYREYLAGNAVSDAELRPIYLRAPQAERERNEKLKQTT